MDGGRTQRTGERALSWEIDTLEPVPVYLWREKERGADPGVWISTGDDPFGATKFASPSEIDDLISRLQRARDWLVGQTGRYR